MKEKKGKGFLIIGMIASVISVIFGIYLLQQFSTFNGGYTEFGGDFYTYIYQRLVDVGNMLEHILEVLIYGFSFLLISIGAIMFCHFGYKIATFDNEPNVIIKEVQKEKTKELAEHDESVPEIEKNEEVTPQLNEISETKQTAVAEEENIINNLIRERENLLKQMSWESNGNAAVIKWKINQIDNELKACEKSLKFERQILGEWIADNSDKEVTFYITFYKKDKHIVADFCDVEFDVEEDCGNYFLYRGAESLWKIEIDGDNLVLVSQINGEIIKFHR